MRLILIATFFFIFASCKEDSLPDLNKGEAYYKTYIETQLEALHLNNLPYGGTSEFKYEDIEHLSHDEIIANFDRMFVHLKEFDKNMRVQDMLQIDKLLKAVQDRGLWNKHPIYKKIRDAETEDEKIRLYTNAMEEVVNNIKATSATNNLQNIENVYEDNSFLFLTTIDGSEDETRAFQSKSVQKKGKDSAIVKRVNERYINGIKVR